MKLTPTLDIGNTIVVTLDCKTWGGSQYTMSLFKKTLICQKIKATSAEDCTIQEIGQYWWKSFSKMLHESYGESFDSQRNLGRTSLRMTIDYFKSDCIAEEIIQEQFEHWQNSVIYEDALSFFGVMSRLDQSHEQSETGSYTS